MKTVKEVSELTGVSIRTLRHYDQIGLLKPTAVSEAGYRLYDETALERLHTILLFRELAFPLKEIKEIIDSPTFDPTEALQQQIELLQQQYKHIGSLIVLATEIQRKGKAAMGFEAFDKTEIEQYRREARERWKSMEAYQEYLQKQLCKTSQEADQDAWEVIRFLKSMGELRHLPPGSAEVQRKVKELQQLFSSKFYHCTNHILSTLGEMYVDHNRFRESIDQECGDGTAIFLRDAIRLYCKQSG